MTLVKDLGMHPSSVRSYRLSTAERIRHLESVQKIPDFQTVIRVIEEHGHPDPSQEQAVFFVHQSHLPEERLREWRGIETFRNFCKIVAFSRVVKLLMISSLCGFPRKRNDGNATPYIWPGFAVTLPVPDAEIDYSNAGSFGVTELTDFLGDLTVHASRMIVLGLRGTQGRYYSPEELRRNVELITANPPYLPDFCSIRQ